MSDMRDKQAGWYESPNSSDEEWYWDGHAWKSRRAAGSTASPDGLASKRNSSTAAAATVTTARFSDRFLAYLIDGALVLPFVVGIVLVIAAGDAGITPFAQPKGTIAPIGPGVGGLIGLLVFGAGAVWVTIWNFVYRQGETGQTVGKQKKGIKLVDVDTLQPVGSRRAWRRLALSWSIDAVAFIVGAIISRANGSTDDWLGVMVRQVIVCSDWPTWDKDGRRLVDKAVRSRVINAN